MKQKQKAVEYLKSEYIKRGDTLPSGVFQDALEMENYSSQTEISDEEIEQAAKEYDRINTIYGARQVFVDAVNWYRESLKNNI